MRYNPGTISKYGLEQSFEETVGCYRPGCRCLQNLPRLVSSRVLDAVGSVERFVSSLIGFFFFFFFKKKIFGVTVNIIKVVNLKES